MLILAVIIYFCFLAQLLFVATNKKYFKFYTVAKSLTSCYFLVLAVLFLYSSAREITLYYYLLGMALVLCAVGDILLGLANNKHSIFSAYFICGIASFLTAHILFSCAYTLIAPLYRANFLLPVISAFVILMCSKSKMFKFKKLKIPVIAYSFAAGFMLSRAISVYFTLKNINGSLLALGSLLFIASDVILLFMYFYTGKKSKLRGANLTTYYIGVFLIVMSILY